MLQLSDSEKVKAIRDYCRHANGTENRYRSPFGLLYSDGVKLLAETCGAYWLVDAIASYTRGPLRGEDFSVWTLEPSADGYPTVQLNAWSDTPKKSKHLAGQHIEYTDFPAELLPIELFVENGLLYFPEER